MSKPRADHVSDGTLASLSLRTKLLGLVTALVLLPGGLYGAIAVSRSRSALAHTIGEQLAGEARNAADRLAAAVRGERDALAASARQDVMREIRIGDLDKRIASFLVSVKSGCPTCLDLFVVDRSQRVVAASDPAAVGRVFAAVGTGADGMESAVVDGPLRSPDGGAPTLRVRVPVPDPDASARELGWLVAVVDWQRETAVTTRVRENLLARGIDADVLVLDAAGVVIGGAPRSDGRWPPGAVLGFAFAADRERAAHAAGVLAGSARLPDDLPPWTLVVAQPLAEAFAPVQRMARLLAAALLATLLTALAVAVIAARRVTRPLDALTAAARDVGRGERPSPLVTIPGGDEIGALAAAFNRMAADLGDAERRLVEAAKFAFVGELAAGVAHEVRTPLGVLRSSTQLLGRMLTAPDVEAQELLQILRDEVDRIERVVSGLLDLGRPHTMRREPAHLGTVVARAVDFIAAQARASDVGLRRRADDPDPVVWCDPDLIYQVALNLILNAVQCVPAGGTIEVAVQPAHDGRAGFEVRDDGPGIPEDLRAQVFQPFFTRREGGTGLGLTFVQRVVLEHGGRVVVGDVRPHGTVFRVELPTSEAAS